MFLFLQSFTEGLKIAMSSIWQNKLRAMLTTFGIVIGILSVTTMSTVIDGIDRSFEKSMEMIGRNVVYIDKWPWGGGTRYAWWEYVNRPPLKVSYVDDLRRLSTTTKAFSAQSGRSVSLKYKDLSISRSELLGTTYTYTETSTADIEEGRFFTDEEERLIKSVAIIGKDIEKTLFPFGNALGKTIKIMGRNFEVIGVKKSVGKFMGMESMDNQVIIPITTFQKYYGRWAGVTIVAKFEDEASLSEGTYELEGLMRRVRRLDPMDKNNFAINRTDMFRDAYKSMTGAIYAVGFFLTALSLFVGGIGVMNIMFVSVKERTKEIGIRKAVGAKSYQILMQFLIEAITICSIGGLVGVLLSLGTSAMINQFFVAHMDWRTVTQAFTICAATGVAFGFFPAYKAAKADPISSLRYE